MTAQRLGFRALDILALTAMCAMAAASTWVALEWISDRPPVEYRAARVVTTQPVRPQQQVTIEYEQRRNRPCPSDIYAWWVDRDRMTADIRLPLVHGGYSQVSDSWYWQPVHLIAPHLAGSWQYRVNMIAFCQDGIFVLVPPVINLEVKE